MTHTALMEVSPTAFAEVESLLRAAGYEHAIYHDQLDMKGIALIAGPGAAAAQAVAEVLGDGNCLRLFRRMTAGTKLYDVAPARMPTHLPHGAEVSAFAITVSANRYADEITVQRARQLEGPPLWKVSYRGSVLNQHGEWEYEPMPSSRTDEFLARCRFTSAERAIAAAQIAKEHLL